MQATENDLFERIIQENSFYIIQNELPEVDPPGRHRQRQHRQYRASVRSDLRQFPGPTIA